MVQQNEPDTISQTPIKKEKESLLSKFEIPIDHLDYKYVETCNNGKELEQILQILQSGQEGFFPHLQKSTEDRLREVNPRSKYLRVAVPILTRKDVTNEEWYSLASDIQSWVDDINKNDSDLLSNKEIKTQSNKVPIRYAMKPVKKSTIKASRIKSMDYESWNKLDIDTEMLKMDLEEEKLKNNSKIHDTKKELKTVLLDVDMMTEVELSHAAVQAKTNGNECFRIGDYEDALQYYTNSINFKPLTATYNNRAIANIKLKHYQDALSDCNKVLKLEPMNEKALYRKAQAFKLLKQFTQAQNVLEKLIQMNPHNLEAQYMIQNVKQISGCKNNVKSVRMAIEDTKQTDLLEKKQEHSKVLVPIPSTSKSVGPFYKEIPEETTRQMKTITQHSEVKMSTLDSHINKIELATKYKTNPVNNCNNDDKEMKIEYHKLNPLKLETALKDKVKPIAKDVHNQDLDIPSQTSKFRTGITETTVEANLNNSEGAMFSENIQNFTPYAFVKYWNSLKLDRSVDYHEKLLRLINPLDLPKVLGNKLDGEMLCTMLKCMATRFMNSKDIHFVGTAITQLAMVSRIDIVLMFMNKEEKVPKVVLSSKSDSMQSQLDSLSITVGVDTICQSISTATDEKHLPTRNVSVSTQTIYIPQKPRSEEIAKSYDCKLSNYKKKIKTLQQGHRRSLKKIEQLKLKLNEYKKKKKSKSDDKTTLNQSLKMLKSRSNLDFLIKNFKTCR